MIKGTNFDDVRTLFGWGGMRCGAVYHAGLMGADHPIIVSARARIR
jgi:hypothetical protein